MKKVVFQTEANHVFNSFQQMLVNALPHNLIIGFQPENDSRKYFLVPNGSAKGATVGKSGTWANGVTQPSQKGEYFIFSSMAELGKWMDN